MSHVECPPLGRAGGVTPSEVTLSVTHETSGRNGDVFICYRRFPASSLQSHKSVASSAGEFARFESRNPAKAPIDPDQSGRIVSLCPAAQWRLPLGRETPEPPSRHADAPGVSSAFR